MAVPGVGCVTVGVVVGMVVVEPAMGDVEGISPFSAMVDVKCISAVGLCLGTESLLAHSSHPFFASFLTLGTSPPSADRPRNRGKRGPGGRTQSAPSSIRIRILIAFASRPCHVMPRLRRMV